MAGRLPPRELYVLTEDVFLEKEIVVPRCRGGRLTVPAGCVCQMLGDRPIRNSTEVTETLIYFEIGGMPFVAWMGSWVLRPYDPEKDAPKEDIGAAVESHGRCVS